MTRYLIGALAIALNLPTATLSPTAVKGPPWISIEYPVSPYDQVTRDAFLVVHAFHHQQPTGFPVSGTAEGIVSGQRRSIPLEFRHASRTGEYTLRKQWPTEGTWTLVIRAVQGENDGVTAVVELASDGQVAKVTVPTTMRNGYKVPAKVEMSDVDAGLRARASR